MYEPSRIVGSENGRPDGGGHFLREVPDPHCTLVHFAISFPHCGHAANHHAKQILADGRLGQVTLLRFHNSHDGTAGLALAHFCDPEECDAGGMLDLGCHEMYLTAWLSGMHKVFLD
ncbi:hypothetical protein KFU94_09680 [Chloroflexi bacterium TSY]|nr:hypothetical protein [Chloroflexi bacterium TSY]